MDYIKSSDKWFIDINTWEFIPENDIPLSHLINVSVPAPLWRFKEEERHVETKRYLKGGLLPKKATIYYTKKDSIQLNGLYVTWSNSCKGAMIVFKDNGREVCLRLTSEPHLGRFKYSGVNAIGTTDVFHELQYDSVIVKTKVVFKETEWEFPYFRPVVGFGDLGKGTSTLRGDNLFMFGLDHRQSRVLYRGKELNGESYAFVCGPWAILLSDALEFDSLVYLNGIRGGVLDVDFIAYTVNSYIVKMKMLIK